MGRRSACTRGEGAPALSSSPMQRQTPPQPAEPFLLATRVSRRLLDRTASSGFKCWFTRTKNGLPACIWPHTGVCGHTYGRIQVYAAIHMAVTAIQLYKRPYTGLQTDKLSPTL